MKGNSDMAETRTFDVGIVVPIMRDEADLWADAARHMGVSPLDLFHLAALSGLRYQLARNGDRAAAQRVEHAVRNLARSLGLVPVERDEGDPEPVTFKRPERRERKEGD